MTATWEPDSDVAAKLATAGLGTVGSTIFRGPERAPSGVVPDAAIFVLDSGGFAPVPYLDGGSKADYQHSVQIMIRAKRNDFSTGQAKAAAVRNALHETTISGYVSCYANESTPNFLGFTDTELIRWTVNLRLRRVG